MFACREQIHSHLRPLPRRAIRVVDWPDQTGYGGPIPGSHIERPDAANTLVAGPTPWFSYQPPENPSSGCIGEHDAAVLQHYTKKNKLQVLLMNNCAFSQRYDLNATGSKAVKTGLRFASKTHKMRFVGKVWCKCCAISPRAWSKVAAWRNNKSNWWCGTLIPKTSLEWPTSAVLG